MKPKCFGSRLGWGMTLILLSCAVLSGCVNPLPWGPGRVKVALERAQVVAAPRRLLFQNFGDSATDETTRDAVKFVFTSKTDLHEYLRDRIIQFRCRVKGAGADYESFGRGPYYQDTLIELLPPSARLEKIAGRHEYSAYAFVGLSVDTETADGGFEDTPLDQLQFSRLSCFIIGVEKAPVLWPRSNDLVLSYEDFMSQLREFRASSE